MIRSEWINFVWLGAAITLIANTIVGTWSVFSITNSQAIVTRSESVQLRLAEILSDVKDAETGQRGFLITQRREFLEPYIRADAEIAGKQNALQEIIANNPEQRERLQELKKMIANLFAIMIESINLAERGKLDLARDESRAISEKNEMDRIRGKVLEMQNFAAEVKRSRVRDAEMKFRSTVAVNVIGTAVALAIVVFAHKLVRRELHKRKRAEAELQLANDRQETVIKDRTKALTQTTSELLRSNQDLEKFAYVASHDLQEPLRKIQAFGDRLKQKADATLDETSRDYVDRMQSAATRMRTLISDLLEYSRVTTSPIVFSPVDLEHVVKVVVSDLELRFEESQGQIDVGPLPTIQADPTQMHQLFQNLLSNALKFRQPGRPPIVKIRAIAASDLSPNAVPTPPLSGWRIILSDNGIGFDQGYSERIFELFQRLHGRGEYEGTGIGLPLCRKIIERHGGRIVAMGQLGVGAEFVVDFPDQAQATGATLT